MSQSVEPILNAPRTSRVSEGRFGARPPRLLLSLHVTILSAMLLVLAVSVGAITSTAFHAWRASVDDLTGQLQQVAADRVQRRIDSLLLTVIRQNELAQTLSVTGDNPEQLQRSFAMLMRAEPALSYLSIGRASDGSFAEVRRRADGSLDAVRIDNRAADGSARRQAYSMRDTSAFVASGPATKVRDDPRTRPDFLSAKSANRSLWTERFRVDSTQRNQLVGAGYVRPLYTTDGRFAGVLSTDITLSSLSDYLRRLPLGRHGFSVLMRVNDNGAPELLASGAPEKSPLALSDTASAESVPKPSWLLALWQAAGSPGPGKRSEEGAGVVDMMGGRYRFTVAPLGSSSAPNWIVASLLPEDEILGGVRGSVRTTLVLIVAAIVITFLMSAWLASTLSKALRAVARDADAIGQLRLTDTALPTSRILEVAQLSQSMGRMKTGLRSFEKFVPADYVRSLLRSGQEARPGGERRRLTVFFADLAGFTTLAEQLAPEEAVALLSNFLEIVSQAVAAHGGVVDKYNGDEVMAFWTGDDQASAACAAALASQTSMDRFTTSANGIPHQESLEVRIGVHTGDAILGVAGSAIRYNYTALGDTVNLGKRLEGQNKQYGSRVCISEETRVSAGDTFLTRPLDKVAVPGRVAPTLVHELIGTKESQPDDVCARADASAAAFDEYQSGRFRTARIAFETLSDEDPADVWARLMRARCLWLDAVPPGEAWNGVFQTSERSQS